MGVVEQIIPYLIGLAGAAAIFVLSKLISWFQSRGMKITDSLREKVQELVNSLAKKAIDIVNQKFVDDLKKANKWVEDREGNALKAIELGLTTLKTLIPKTWKKVLEKLYGKDIVDEYLKSTIELNLKAMANNQKTSQAISQ